MRARTRIVLSIDQPAEVLDDDGCALLADVIGTAARMGEPFIRLFRRDEMERLLRDHGFDSVGHFGTPDATLDYFGGTALAYPTFSGWSRPLSASGAAEAGVRVDQTRTRARIRS